MANAVNHPHLRPKETKLLRHALGLTGRSKVADRFGAYATGPDIETWLHLVELGLAVENEHSRTPLSRYYHVTRAGFEAVRSDREKLNPDVADLMDGLERGRAA